MAEPAYSRPEARTPLHQIIPGAAYAPVPRPAPEVRQAYQLLYFAFIAAPLLAGIDKFTYFLTDWTNYLAPVFPRTLGIGPVGFMQLVGMVEIIAAIGVAFKPRIFGYVVAAWLAGVIVNLLMLGQYYDVALRDLGLGIAAVSLARLAVLFETENRTDEA